MTEFLTLKDHVYNYIAEKIMRGELSPNEKVNENEIVNKLNISRTPVREALIQLASEGLLENIPRRGFVLNNIDESTAIDLYSLIGLLEGYAAKIVAPEITENELKLMEFYVSSIDLAIESGNNEMYYNLQTKFHDTYLGLCKNKLLRGTLDQFKHKFFRRTYKEQLPGDLHEVLKATNVEHRKIMDLFRENKVDEIENAIRDHWNIDFAYLETL